MVKFGWIVALFLVVVLVVSSLSLLMVRPASAQSSNAIIVTPTPTLIPALIPTPITASNFALSYSEVSRASQGNDTQLVLDVTARYNSGEPVTINFQSFNLNIGVGQGENLIFPYNAKPIESGTLITDSNTAEKSFYLTFVFPTYGYRQSHFSSYQLVYFDGTTIALATSSTPTITPSPIPTIAPTINPTATPTPTVPEFPLLAVLPLFLSVLFIAVKLKHRKTAK